MFPPKQRCFPEYQACTHFFAGQHETGAAVGPEHFPVEDREGPAVGGGAGQDVVQVGVDGGGQHGHGFVAVAVGGGAGDAESCADQAEVAAGADPDQGEQGLPVAGQGAGPGAGTDLAAVRGQQGGKVVDELSGDVEHGRIGDHVGSSRVVSCGENYLPGTPRCLPPLPVNT